MIENYWLLLARTYYMLVKKTKRTSHALLGKQAALRAIEEESNNVYRLPPIPTNTMVWDRRKFLRY